MGLARSDDQYRILFGDELDARNYWADKEYKKFAVTVTAGPEKKPTFNQVHYAGASTSEGAIEAVKRQLITKPSRARYTARLAGPKELGCVRTNHSKEAA